jgi:radical SAM/Cys-rich protein
MTAEKSYDFKGMVMRAGQNLLPTGIETLQLNITKLCNQVCTHCHVDASPKRREMMKDDVIEACFTILKDPRVKNLDITGGAPELHAKFREMVTRAKAMGKHVMVRHNLTVTLDPHPVTKESLEYLPQFFSDHKVEVISSLPFYQEFFTNKQRGDGVFQKSIKSLQLLNEKGFGVQGTGKLLNLVYNPAGAFLPAPQAGLEADYKRELQKHFGITFNNLFAITNMPIHRFKANLVKNGGYEEYMEKLVAAFNPAAAAGVMCRSLVSVSYDGKIYDCDFNQMLNMQVNCGSEPATVFNFDFAKLTSREIRVASHCLGCTAGAGSSCGGNTAA